ncbi:unnamed protein product [Cunninghamella echinulata]
MNDTNQAIALMMERSFSILFNQHLAQNYPLIFSPSYIEKLNATTKYIPNIARSFQRFISIADTSSRTNFKEKVQHYLDVSKEKITILHTYHHQQQENYDTIGSHLWNDLVISLYYSAKNSSTLRNHKNSAKINDSNVNS